MGVIKISGWKCERCFHVWKARNTSIPIVCAKCKSPYWNKPKQKKRLKNKTKFLK